MPISAINIGILGLGTVGSGVVDILNRKGDEIASQIGCPVRIKRILVRDPHRKRSVEVDRSLLTTDPDDILKDDDIRIVVELMGGENPACEYIERALGCGKHVVTANKEVMAKHGPELLMLAHQHGVDLLYEASVGGGIPLIAPFKHDLCANRITSIRAIINGTTNYILTRMSREGAEFHVALRQAQELGYAESDPANDIEGRDAAYKLAILATLAFRVDVRPENVYCEGITRLTARDFRYAQELGYAIKLLAIGKDTPDGIEARVHPAFIPKDAPLASVDGVFNAVYVEGDLVGNVLFYGRGAGALPTGSAVVADLVELARNVRTGTNSRFKPHLNKDVRLKPMADVETRYYLRMNVLDRYGVLAQMAKVLGDNRISIASVIQKESNPQAQTAEVVIMTHPARESSMQKALGELAGLPIVKDMGSFIRVED